MWGLPVKVSASHLYRKRTTQAQSQADTRTHTKDTTNAKRGETESVTPSKVCETWLAYSPPSQIQGQGGWANFTNVPLENKFSSVPSSPYLCYGEVGCVDKQMFRVRVRWLKIKLQSNCSWMETCRKRLPLSINATCYSLDMSKIL